MSARTDVIYTIKHLKIRKIWKHTSHSYKLVNFTCAECEFIVECELTMDLHVGRFHSEDFDLGLYDAIFKNREDLETHLPSCDEFKCRECGKTGRILKEMKEHTA